MLTIPRDVFNTHIAPHLDGREALFLSLSCKQLAQWVESNPLLQRYIRWHWIRLGDVSELEPWLEYDLSIRMKKRKYPWDFGENVQFTKSYMISNFYVLSNRLELDAMLSRIAEDTNKWRFFTYPPLEGTRRWRLGPLYFHRGGSIQIFE
jgi:hypothetical protein